MSNSKTDTGSNKNSQQKAVELFADSVIYTEQKSYNVIASNDSEKEWVCPKCTFTISHDNNIIGDRVNCPLCHCSMMKMNKLNNKIIEVNYAG
ncbi:MAG: hypothetical protein ABIJ12_08730 [bacterium]